jgi:Cu/Ag efflux pump CusA
MKASLTIRPTPLPGTSLAKSDEIGRRVEQILLAEPEVVATARRTGRAELDEHVQGVEAAEIRRRLAGDAAVARGELLASLRRGFSTLPGTNVTIGQPISHRIDHMLSGTRANIAIKVFRRRPQHAAAGWANTCATPSARCRGSSTCRSSSR